MKLRNIFMTLLAVLFVAVGCVEEHLDYLPELQVEKSIVGLPMDGGSSNVLFTATDTWEIKYFTKKKNEETKKDEIVEAPIPEWLSVSPLNGESGETSVSFSVEESEIPHEVNLEVHTASGDVQHLLVKQGELSKELTPLKDCTIKGMTYYFHGTIQSIRKTDWGGLTLVDKEGNTLEVWGTLSPSGEEKKFFEWGLVVGDEVWGHGTISSYGNVDPMIIDKYKKSLVLPEEDNDKFELEKNEQTLNVNLKVAGDGLTVYPEADWITFVGINVVDEAGVLTLNISENTDLKPREALVRLVSTKFDEKTSKTDTSKVSISIRQKGNVPEPSKISEAASKEYVNVSGLVAGLCSYGYVLKDETGSIFVYSKDPEYELGANLNVVGKVGCYNFGAQLKPDLVTLGSKGDLDHGEPVVLDAAKMTEIAASTKDKDKNKDKLVVCQYVKVSGHFTKDVSKDGKKTFWNLAVSGYSGNASVYGITSEQETLVTPFIDKDVDIYGYLVQLSGGKYFSIILTDIRESGAVVLEPLIEESFRESKGSFTIESPMKPTADKDSWYYSQYKDKNTHEVKDAYMKASAFIYPNAYASESYLISPVISLAGRPAAKLKFDHAGNNFPKDAEPEVALPNMKKAVSVVVRKEGEQNWTPVEISGWPTATNYNYVTAEVDLSAFAEQSIQIAFKYTSTVEICGTWQIKNVSVK